MSKEGPHACFTRPHRLAVEYNETTGKIAFDDERSCVLHAGPDALEIDVETASDEQLQRTQDTVVTHLKRFAFREDFGEIGWRRLE